MEEEEEERRNLCSLISKVYLLPASCNSAHASKLRLWAKITLRQSVFITHLVWHRTHITGLIFALQNSQKAALRDVSRREWTILKRQLVLYRYAAWKKNWIIPCFTLLSAPGTLSREARGNHAGEGHLLWNISHFIWQCNDNIGFLLYPTCRRVWWKFKLYSKRKTLTMTLQYVCFFYLSWLL